jgi:uncharacterized protein (DUF1684 family)
MLLAGCTSKPAPKPGPRADTILQERTEKDRAFKNDPGSPLPEKERQAFAGLSYFPPDPQLRFQAKLNRYDRPETVRIGTNTGEIRTGLRYGYFEFEIDGRLCRLQVYRMQDSTARGAPSLFVPFRDATTGKETYAAGRYLDLRENTSGTYELDFNRAYNPSCAYGRGDYSCPVPPAENTLAVAVKAGEKKYSQGEHN